MEAARRKILTVPNLLSLLRLGLIPVFVSCYIRGLYVETAVFLILSGLTDVADGWIARRFGAISDLGKVLDPAADKLTQAAMLLMLIGDHPQMQLPFILLMIKESIMSVMGLLVIRSTGAVPSAVWHGKLTTMLLFLIMFMHVIWKDIPAPASNTMIVLCMVMMLYSLAAYAISNARRIRCSKAAGTPR